MGFFSKTKKKDRLVMVFDLSSSSVGGAIFVMQDSDVPKILFTIREPIFVEKELDIENFFDLTIKTMRVVVAKMCVAGLGKPDKIFCVLSSPWYHSIMRDITLQKETPFVFNTKLADELTKKEVDLFLESYRLNNKDTGSKEIPIEMKTMSVSLNGYEVNDPYNKKASSLDISLFISISEESFIHKVEEAIMSHFHFESIKYSSFLMASFVVARDMFINQDKFLLINIGGEITDISMIKKNVIRDSVSFPMGYNFMIRGLAKDLNMSIEEARSFLSLYKDNHGSDSTNKSLENSIETLKNTWLNNLSHDISIPATIFITIDQDLFDFFSEIIKAEQLNQYTLTESKFRIIFLGTEALHGIASFENEKIKRDSLLIMESIYINHFLK